MLFSYENFNQATIWSEPPLKRIFVLFIPALLICFAIDTAPSSAQAHCGPQSIYVKAAKAAILKLEATPLSDLPGRERLFDNAHDSLREASKEASQLDDTYGPQASLCVLTDESVLGAWLSLAVEDSYGVLLAKIHSSKNCMQLERASREEHISNAASTIAMISQVGQREYVLDTKAFEHVSAFVKKAAINNHMKMPPLDDIDSVKAYALNKKSAFETQKATMTERCAGDADSAIRGMAVFIFGI